MVNNFSYQLTSHYITCHNKFSLNFLYLSVSHLVYLSIIDMPQTFSSLRSLQLEVVRPFLFPINILHETVTEIKFENFLNDILES